MRKKVVAIGEILWDLFPDGKKAGGSSMNVALHLHKQGIDSKLISAVGNDPDGPQLLDFLAEQQFPPQLIQRNHLPTGTVQVSLDDQKQASYVIVSPVAWDEIVLSREALEEVAKADAFVYCSLTCRNETSRATVLSLLDQQRLNVFDINLRPPYNDITLINLLLNKATILKINEEELLYLQQQLDFSANTQEQLMKQLAHHFGIHMICLTLGEKGACILHEGKLYAHRGYPAVVTDTVGAGDAFLATLVASYLNGYSVDMMLDRACKVGAFVASQSGANPKYDSNVFE